MILQELIDESQQFADELLEILTLPVHLDIDRCRISGVLCSLSFEYWNSTRKLLECGMLPSAAIVQRSQFEAIVRSIWLLNVASNEQVLKLSIDLNEESERSAKNIPLANDMLNALANGVDRNAYDALMRFKDNSWNALNSFVHSGIHAIYRHKSGYPQNLLIDVLKNSNGLAVLAGMQYSILSGFQNLQKSILELAEDHSLCMPPPLKQ